MSVVTIDPDLHANQSPGSSAIHPLLKEYTSQQWQEAEVAKHRGCVLTARLLSPKTFMHGADTQKMILTYFFKLIKLNKK